MKLPLLLMLSASGVCLSAGSFDARAAITTVTEANPAVGVCQAARSANEGALRKRPMGVQNEGPSTVFVSCGLHGNGPAEGIGPYTSEVSFILLNIGTTPATVNCTAIDTAAHIIGATRSITVMPGQTPLLTFVGTDIASNRQWFSPAFSCSLAPGAGISEVWHHFAQQISPS